MCEILPSSLDSDELLDVAPPRCQILVTERPIDADALARVGLEVEIAPAIDAASPHNRASANMPPAYPVKRLPLGKRVGIVEIVDEKLAGVLVAGTGMSLDGLIA